MCSMVPSVLFGRQVSNLFSSGCSERPVDPILPSGGDGCGIASGGAITGPQEAEKDALSSRSGKDAGKPAPPLGEAGSPVTAAVREAAVNMTNT